MVAVRELHGAIAQALSQVAQLHRLITEDSHIIQGG